jgi:hypothetical protein
MPLFPSRYPTPARVLDKVADLWRPTQPANLAPDVSLDGEPVEGSEKSEK